MSGLLAVTVFLSYLLLGWGNPLPGQNDQLQGELDTQLRALTDALGEYLPDDLKETVQNSIDQVREGTITQGNPPPTDQNTDGGKGDTNEGDKDEVEGDKDEVEGDRDEGNRIDWMNVFLEQLKEKAASWISDKDMVEVESDVEKIRSKMKENFRAFLKMVKQKLGNSDKAKKIISLLMDQQKEIGGDESSEDRDNKRPRQKYDKDRKPSQLEKYEKGKQSSMMRKKPMMKGKPMDPKGSKMQGKQGQMDKDKSNMKWSEEKSDDKPMKPNTGEIDQEQEGKTPGKMEQEQEGKQEMEDRVFQLLRELNRKMEDGKEKQQTGQQQNKMTKEGNTKENEMNNGMKKPQKSNDKKMKGEMKKPKQEGDIGMSKQEKGKDEMMKKPGGKMDSKDGKQGQNEKDNNKMEGFKQQGMDKMKDSMQKPGEEQDTKDKSEGQQKMDDKKDSDTEAETKERLEELGRYLMKNFRKD